MRQRLRTLRGRAIPCEVSASTNGKTKTRTVKVQSDDFLRDPAATMRRVLATGRVVVVDSAGQVQVVISTPLDTIRVPKF